MIHPDRAWLTLLRPAAEQDGVAMLFDATSQTDINVRQKAFYEGMRRDDGAAEAAAATQPVAQESWLNRLWRRVRSLKAEDRRQADYFARHLETVLAEAPAGASGRARVRIIEVGCGAGTVLTEAALANRDRVDYVGIDLALGPLLSLRKRFDAAGAGHFALVCDDFLAENFEPGSFDALYALACVHHFDRAGKRRFADKTRALLKPGGRGAFVEALNINPLLAAARAATRPGRPNLAWEHPFSMTEIEEFLGAFPESEARYFEGLRNFALFAAFHPGLLRATARALQAIDERLARHRLFRRLFTAAFFAVRTAPASPGASTAPTAAPASGAAAAPG
ncbi:MAG: class I SAM-dependent methyltransferase [Alphaproteobacteria bacterium]|nr:class I SAM-dependent methyltransferase [Alphaproteobacteria bacterium]